MRKSLHIYIPASLLLVFLAMILWMCGGGGGDGGGVTTSTFTGSVSGTLVLAVDENGIVAAKDDTAGKTPDGSGYYPFSLTVPAGHQYTIYFIVEEGTPTERIVPLFSGTTNIFSVTGGGTIDLGYVDTDLAEATAENDPLASAGVTSGGATGPDTISMQNSNPIFILINRSDVGKKYRTQVGVRHADGTVLTDGALVKDVVVYGPDGQELPLDGSFYYWDGLTMYMDNGRGPILTPYSDIEVYLAASPGSLPDGFYTEVVTDSNRNLHMVKLYFEQPTEVDKPTNLAQDVNPDGSMTLSWTNPADIAGSEYSINIEIQHSCENGDGYPDIAEQVGGLNASNNSYTIPAGFVSSNLAGKQELIWRVQVRQRIASVAFPDGTTKNTQIYRNYSANQPLSVTPPTVIPFTTGMLSGKAFVPSGDPGEVDLILFAADGTGTEYDGFDDGQGGGYFDMSSMIWSIDVNGRLLIELTDYNVSVVVTLLAETATYLDIQAQVDSETETGRLTKVIPFVAAQVPGTYTVEGAQGVESITFVAGGTGFLSTDEGPVNFTWSLDGAGVMNLTTAEWSRTVYLLAGSTTSTLNMVDIAYEAGTPVQVDAVTFIRQSDISFNVTGTISLPQSVNCSMWLVAVDNDNSGDNGFVANTYGSCDGRTSISYSIANVQSGTYYVYGTAWVVGEPLTAPIPGDYSGYYPDGYWPGAPNAIIPASGTVNFDIPLMLLTE